MRRRLAAVFQDAPECVAARAMEAELLLGERDFSGAAPDRVVCCAACDRHQGRHAAVCKGGPSPCLQTHEPNHMCHAPTSTALSGICRSPMALACRAFATSTIRAQLCAGLQARRR